MGAEAAAALGSELQPWFLRFQGLKGKGSQPLGSPHPRLGLSCQESGTEESLAVAPAPGRVVPGG